MQLELFEVLKEEQQYTKNIKKCSCCKVLLPYAAFGKNKSKSLGLACTCKECLKESSAVLKVLHNKYIIPEGHTCPICLRKKRALYTGSKRSEQPFRLDHDKATGGFRGFICDSCNTGLGKFGDSEETIKRAWEYLNER